MKELIVKVKELYRENYTRNIYIYIYIYIDKVILNINNYYK